MISIIVPVFNVEQYLQKCLNSIAGQTFKNWEALLIDDGSTDKSGVICDSFVLSDNRFKVIHQNNAGLSEARNAGLKAATGDYICFIDGDDYIHPRFLEIMYDSILKYNADVVIDTPRSASWEEDVFFSPIGNFNITDLSRHDLFVSLFYIHKKFHSVAVWNKMFRRDIITDIFFENITSEDLEFLSRLYHRVKNGILLDAQLYFYVKRPGSITSNGFTLKNLGETDTFLRVLDNLKSSQKLERAYCLQQLYLLLPRLRQISKNSGCQKETRLVCRDTLQKTISEFLMNKRIPLAKKLGILTFNFLPFSYALFLKFRT